jgi:hypothetical protein
MNIELNNTNCKEYTDIELAEILGIESLESLDKKYKKNEKAGKKAIYNSIEFKALIIESLEIKKTILELYGKDALLDVIMPNTKGCFKLKKSNGNYLD